MRFVLSYIQALTIALAGAGCSSPASQSDSQLYDIQIQSRQPIVEISDFSSAKSYAVQNGYYNGRLCGSYLKGGEKVWYSASYGQGEAGQAFGELAADGDKLFFVQQGMPTHQLMLAPGLAGFSGKSLWEFKRYFNTVCSVAFGQGARGPDYQSIKAEKISMSGGTAGGSVAWQDALQISLRSSGHGGISETVIIFAKGLGPRVVEFSENTMPAGTAKVYISQ